MFDLKEYFQFESNNQCVFVFKFRYTYNKTSIMGAEQLMSLLEKEQKVQYFNEIK